MPAGWEKPREKLYNSTGRELRRALFSLKQIFQDDKDLVHEFVVAEGLTCLIKVGAEADQNYQNYILRALGQIMLYVDGMNGLIGHNETVQWLYTLVGSKVTAVNTLTVLKWLSVVIHTQQVEIRVEKTECSFKQALNILEVPCWLSCLTASDGAAVRVTEGPFRWWAVNTVDTKRGCKLWSNTMEILDEKDGVDTELLVYVMTLINKIRTHSMMWWTVWRSRGIEVIGQRHLNRKGTDLDLLEQFNIYEMTLRHEDGDDETAPPPVGRKDRRRASLCGRWRGVAWSVGGAADTRFKMAKAPLLLPPPPAIATPPASCRLTARGLRTSQRGENELIEHLQF
ncbi:hypothetical protein SRHO_G00062910 [Serrasalmus rhombeus]